MRAIRFIYRAIQHWSIASAIWIDAYENFKPTHGK